MRKKELRREREERRRQDYRRLIVQAAERLIARKGYSAMTMDDVAREAEFSKATLYHYFRSKSELTMEILATFFEETDRQVRKILALRKSAKEKLRRGIRFYLQFNLDKENISRMLFMDPSFIEKMRIFMTEEKKLASETDRRFIARIKAKRREILDGVAEILKEGVAGGEFRKLDITGAVTFLESVLQGYSHVRFWQARPYTVNEATEVIHGFVLRGIDKKARAAKGES
jgi:AcrR family transcriptional regulator